MYSSINVVRVISIILEKVYENPKKFFRYKNELGQILPPPPREALKTFLLKTLREFTKVRTPVGIFQQTEGLSMGSSLSPMMANILANDLEQKIVKKYEKNNKIVHYTRYVDDSIIIIRKNSLRLFLKEMNSYDSKLNFTLEEMNCENKLIFLDMLVFVDENNSLEFIKYRKDSTETVITNFEKSVVSKRYTKGGIMTNIHREYDTCSTDALFLESLEELKEVYANNLYPKKLVESKINSFSANFEKPDREPFVHTIVLEYASPLIESYIHDLTKKINNYMPKFRINIAYRSVKVKKLFGYMAKPKKELFENSNCVYEYTCPCEQFYIGHTKRTLYTRADEHYTNDSSKIWSHNDTCEFYKNESKKFVKENKKVFREPITARFEYFKTRFKIIGKGYKSDENRERAEAFLIRTNRPSINKQTDQYAFRLF